MNAGQRSVFLSWQRQGLKASTTLSDTEAATVQEFNLSSVFIDNTKIKKQCELESKAEHQSWKVCECARKALSAVTRLLRELGIDYQGCYQLTKAALDRKSSRG